MQLAQQISANVLEKLMQTDRCCPAACKSMHASQSPHHRVHAGPLANAAAAAEPWPRCSCLYELQLARLHRACAQQHLRFPMLLLLHMSSHVFLCALPSAPSQCTRLLTAAYGAAADEPHPSRDFLHALQQADKMRKDKGDSYLGVDCLFIAVLNEKDVASALADAGVGKLQIETALLDLRGKDKSKKASPHSCMHTLPLHHTPQGMSCD